jgi:hypothetical protein
MPLGTSARKEGAVLVVGTGKKRGRTQTPKQKKKRDVASTDLERRKR